MRGERPDLTAVIPTYLICCAVTQSSHGQCRHRNVAIVIITLLNTCLLDFGAAMTADNFLQFRRTTSHSSCPDLVRYRPVCASCRTVDTHGPASVVFITAGVSEWHVMDASGTFLVFRRLLRWHNTHRVEGGWATHHQPTPEAEPEY